LKCTCNRSREALGGTGFGALSARRWRERFETARVRMVSVLVLKKTNDAIGKTRFGTL
jgi:hypothetical protein